MKRISLTTIALLMSMIGTANADTTLFQDQQLSTLSWFDKMYEGTWMTEYDSVDSEAQNYIDFDEETYNFPAPGTLPCGRYTDSEIEAYNQSNGYWS